MSPEKRRELFGKGDKAGQSSGKAHQLSGFFIERASKQ